MTLSFIVGPIIALIVFIIFITDKWKIVTEGKKRMNEKEIYKQYHDLKSRNIRCKIVRVDRPILTEGACLQLFVMEKDLSKISNLGQVK